MSYVNKCCTERKLLNCVEKNIFLGKEFVIYLFMINLLLEVLF